MVGEIKQCEIEALLDYAKQDEIASKMGFSDSLEENVASTNNFLYDLESALKQQDVSIQDFLDDVENLPPEAREKLLDNAKSLKDMSSVLFSMCKETREKFNNAATGFQTNRAFLTYFTLNVLPVIEKIGRLNGGL